MNSRLLQLTVACWAVALLGGGAFLLGGSRVSLDLGIGLAVVGGIVLFLLVHAHPELAVCVVLGSFMIHALYGFIMPAGAYKYVEPGLLAMNYLAVGLKKWRSPARVGAFRLSDTLPLAILALCGYTLVRGIFTEHAASAVAGFSTISLYAALFFLAAWTLESAAQIRFVVYFFLVGCFALALVGLGQAAFGWDFQVFGESQLGSGDVRIGSTLGNFFDMSIYMMTAVTICASMAIRTSVWKRRAVTISLIVICGIALVLTFTRSAWMGLSIALTILLMGLGRRQLLSLVPTGAALVMGVLVAVTVFVSAPDVAVTRFVTGFDFKEDNVNRERMGTWQKGWEMATESLPVALFGHGLGSVGMPAARVFVAEHGINSPWELHRYYFETESWVLHLLNEAGVIALLLYLFIIYTVFRTWRAGQSAIPPELMPALKGMAAALASIYAANVILPSLQTYPVSSLSWTIVGILYASMHLQDSPLTVAAPAAEARPQVATSPPWQGRRVPIDLMTGAPRGTTAR
jgi:hypothetical protein